MRQVTEERRKMVNPTVSFQSFAEELAEDQEDEGLLREEGMWGGEKMGWYASGWRKEGKREKWCKACRKRREMDNTAPQRWVWILILECGKESSQLVRVSKIPAVAHHYHSRLVVKVAPDAAPTLGNCIMSERGLSRLCISIDFCAAITLSSLLELAFVPLALVFVGQQRFYNVVILADSVLRPLVVSWTTIASEDKAVVLEPCRQLIMSAQMEVRHPSVIGSGNRRNQRK